MAQSLSKVYVHIVLSTKNRQNLIRTGITKSLFKYVGGICRGLDCNPIIVGGHKNHIHILCLLSKIITQIKLLEEIKKGSSKWIKTKGAEYRNFYWQDGYGIFSVSSNEIVEVKSYIENQEKHHCKIDFKDELRTLFKKNNIEYDKKYVWD